MWRYHPLLNGASCRRAYIWQPCVFLLMEDTLDASTVEDETRLLFDHAAAQAALGASVFWLRRLAAWEGAATAIEYWQVKRGGDRRGIR